MPALFWPHHSQAGTRKATAAHLDPHFPQRPREVLGTRVTSDTERLFFGG